MEQKELNLSIIFSMIVFAIGVAVRGLSSLFNGFGVLFVTILIMLALVVAYGTFNANNRKKIIDLVIMVIVSLIFILILFCSYEWAFEIDRGLNNFVRVFSIIYSVISLLFLIYGIIKFIVIFFNKPLNVVNMLLNKFENKNTNPENIENNNKNEITNSQETIDKD